MTNSKYTEEQIKKAMNNAKASLEIEGYIVKKEYEELVRKSLLGEISEEEFQECAKKLVLKSKRC
ncbi:antitoxin VbhA family protein [Niallia sp. Sow4_A1]|uniref:antitoxin VbhA family protein n=1 Tax=unclassified Niallia TaxID=2837522 RepID=UPI0020412F9A|nr:antitoxin VbhA family protein [Niallia sp. MER TA 168]MCM3363764.1 antitoxin VbhA family protein [Niallia sp. MER TA 168]